MPSESETALIAFGSRGAGRGPFPFFKLLKTLPSMTKLIVRDPSDRWYNAGLPGFGDTPEEIAQQLERELSRLGARRFITFGASMGGYAAILFGCLIGAERVVALAPQTILDPRLPHAPSADQDLLVPDLASTVRCAPATKVDLVVGWDELVDVFHADRLASLPSVRVFAIRRGVHLFIRDLHREGELAPLITTLIDGGTPKPCDLQPPLPSDMGSGIGEAIYAARRGDWSSAAQRMRPIAGRFPDWAGSNYQLGNALAAMRKWDDAEAALTRAMRVNPDWPRPRARLVRALREQGRLHDAEPILRDGLAIDPDWWSGNLDLGECLLQQGRAAEARTAALEAERILRGGLAAVPKWANGHLDLGRALLMLGREEEARAAALRAVELNPKLSGAAERLLE